MEFTESDKEYIKEQFMEDIKGYPKYQYSVFTKNGRDEQLVIRADTFEELKEAKLNIDKILEKRAEASQNTPQSVPAPIMNRPCTQEGCQGTQTYRNGISKKTNKPYAGWFCELSKDHTNWDK